MEPTKRAGPCLVAPSLAHPTTAVRVPFRADQAQAQWASLPVTGDAAPSGDVDREPDPSSLLAFSTGRLASENHSRTPPRPAPAAGRRRRLASRSLAAPPGRGDHTGTTPGCDFSASAAATALEQCRFPPGCDPPTLSRRNAPTLKQGEPASPAMAQRPHQQSGRTSWPPAGTFGG
jgi:hypothetical protein